MIGTTLSLGFDGRSAIKGIGNVSSLLGRVGKQFAIGGVRRAGEKVTDLLGRVLTAAPAAIAETADWAGTMVDMSAQTGVAVDRLIMLEEKLRLAGASAADSSRMISVLADNLYTASTEGGNAKDALNKLGFSAQHFKGVFIDTAFDEIGAKVAALGPEFKGLESIMADLFGARMGYKLIRLFRDVEGTTKRAQKNVGDLAEFMAKGQAGALDEFSDALGRWETTKRHLSSIVMDQLFRVTGGSGGVDRLFDGLNPEKIRPKVEALTSLIGRNLEVVLDQGISKSLGDIMRNLGKSFGEGIKANFDIKSLLPTMPSFNLFGNQSSNGSPTDELKRHTALLRDIRKEVGVSKFA